MGLPRSRDLRMAAISFVIVFGGLVFPWYTSAFFHSSMPTYKYEVSSAVDGGNSNSWIKQESSFQDEVLKNFNVEHWLIMLIMHTPDNLHHLSLCGWIGSKHAFTNSVMMLKMDESTYSVDFSGQQFRFEDNQPNNVVVGRGDVEVVIYPNEVRVLTVHTTSGTFSFTMVSRGLPLWLARNEGEMIVCSKNHFTGYPYYMGGFGDLVTVSGTVQDKDFEGYGLYCHWWTNEFIMQDWASLFVNQEDFYLMTWQSWNKTNPHIEYLSTGFLGFPKKNLYYSFDNFTFISRGSSDYTIIGNYEKGFLNIDGKKVAELMNNYQTGIHVQWDGILTFNQEEIAVDAEGSGEIVGERHVWARASFEYSPEKPLANEHIAFNASASYSPGGNITSYEWNFDDGNTTEVTEPIINHTYALSGNYTVTLKVTDDNNLWNTTTKTITVYFERIYTFNVSCQGSDYTIIVVSNSTVTNFNFNYSLKQISFNVKGLPATMGYCNISIPKTLMWCDSPSQWTVTVDLSPVKDLTVAEDTHTCLFFTYNHSTYEIIIEAVNVVSEFPSLVILLPIMMITLLGVGFAKTSERLRMR